MPLDIFNDKEFQSLDYDKKQKIATNYFNKEMADDSFKKLDSARQEKIITRFLADNVGSKPQPERNWEEAARDFPMQIGAGVGSLVETAGDTYGLISGNMDNKVSKMGKTIGSAFKKEYSQPLKDMEKSSQAEIDKETGEWNKFVKTVENTATNPALASKTIVESIPMLLASGGVGRAAKIITNSAKAGTWGAVGTGGVLQGADMGSETYDTLMKLDDNYWSNIPEFQEAVKSGVNPQNAKNEISLGISRVVAGASGALSIGANKFISGGDVVENVLTGNSIGAGMLKGGLKGVIGEGVTEGLEEGGGKTFQNIGVQQVNPNQPTFQGVGQATGTGLVAGGFTGGVAGTVGGATNVQPQQQQEVAQPQEQPKQKTADEILATPMKDLIAEIKQSKVFGDTKAKSEAMAVDVGDINYEQMAQDNQPEMSKPQEVSQTLDNNLDIQPQQEPINTEVAPQEVRQDIDKVNQKKGLDSLSSEEIDNLYQTKTKQNTRDGISSVVKMYQDELAKNPNNEFAKEQLDWYSSDKLKIQAIRMDNIFNKDKIQPQEVNQQEPTQTPDYTNTIWDDAYVEKLNKMEEQAKSAGNDKAVFEIAKEKAKVENLMFSKYLDRKREETTAKIESGEIPEIGREVIHPDKNKQYFLGDSGKVYFKADKWYETKNENTINDIKFIAENGKNKYLEDRLAKDEAYKQAVKESEEREAKAKESYKMQHTAPTKGYGTRGDNLIDAFGTDIYTANAERYFGHGQSKMDKESIRVIQKIKNNPNAEVTIYRAIPKDINAEINPNDWVTTSKEYAKTHGEGPLKGNYKILEKKVKASEIYTDGNSIHEWGYSPENNVLESKFKQQDSTTVSEAINQTKKLLGKKFDEVTKNVEFVQSANELPTFIKKQLGANEDNVVKSGGIPRGIFDPQDNKIYLIADSMKANEVQGVILHELLHRAINGMVKDGQSRLDAILGSNLKPLTDRLNQLAAQGDKTVAQAFKRVKSAGVPKANQLEETMTYLLENHTNDKNNSNALNRWISDVIQAIKDFIRKVATSYGIDPNWFISRMNASDIATVLRDTAINGKDNLTKGNILASKKSRLEEWHKDSSPLTKNEDGSPKVFYHQTSKKSAKSIYDTKFDINKVGARGTDNGTPDGFFFKTNDKDIGVGSSKKENIEQMPVYLKIKNPLMVKNRDTLKWQMSTESEKYKNLLEEAKQIDKYFGKIDAELEAQAKEVGYKLRADRENKKLQDEYYAISDKQDENFSNWEEAVNKNAEESRKELTATIKKMGYDGINLQQDEGSFGRSVNTWIVFEPTQIKSVNNQGTFDETNPNILYSKEAVKEREKTKLETIKKWVSDKAYDVKSTNGMSALLYVTTRQQKTDMFKDIAPELQTYDDLVEAKIAEANKIAKISGDIAEKTRKWAVKNKAEADKLFKFMGETTIEGIDPTKSFEEQKKKAERFYTYADKVGIEYDKKDREKLSKERYNFIKAKYDALPNEAKEIYSTMKEHYERLADKMFIALKNKVTEAELDENVKTKLIDKLRVEFESRKVVGPYFPLMRFGEYVVTGKDKDGEPVVERYETPSERDNRATEMEQEGYSDIKKTADVNKNVNLQADTAFMSDVLKQIEEVNPLAFESISEDVYQLYLKYLPNMSTRKAFIHRKGIKGYSDDMLRTFAAKTFHLGRQIANINYLDKMQREIDRLEKRVKETGDPKLKVIYEDLLKTHDHIVNPEFNQLAQHLTSLGFFWYMTSLSAGILNLSQVALVVFPKLAGKYGVGKAMFNLTKSIKDLTMDNLAPDEKQFIEEMKDNGIIDLTMTHDLAGLGDHYNDIKYGPLTTVKRVLSIPQHYSEVGNRMVTLLTTYRLSRDKGNSNPTKEAIATNYETNFNYTNENRNRLMRNPIAKVVTQFKNYSVQMLYFMLKHSFKALKGDKEALKTMGTLMFVGTALSGVKGMPLQALYAMAGLGGVDDPEDELYKNIKEVFGEYTDLVWRGVVNYITGADIGGRTGLSDMLLKSPTREMNTKDTINHYTTQILGPSLSIFTNFALGISDIARGEAQRGIEKTMPKPIKDILQSIRFGQEGARDNDFKPIVEEFSPYELAVKTVGFQPESLAKQQESNMRVLRVKARIDNERSEILKNLRKANVKDNKELWQETMKKIQEFNDKYPSLAIKNDTIRRSLLGDEKDRAKSVNGLNIAPKYEIETQGYK